MNLKIYLMLVFININFGNFFLEKLAQQSNLNKTFIGIAAVLPLIHGCFIQYHLKKEHTLKIECQPYSSHYLINIPYVNILFYINTVMTKGIVKFLKKEHDDTCLLLKSNYKTKHNEETKKCIKKINLYTGFCFSDIICYCFLGYKLIRIAQ
jgi:hypothetical protein